MIRVAQFGCVDPPRQEWASAFYAAGRAHNVLMDALVGGDLGVEQKGTAYWRAVEVAPELSGSLLKHVEHCYTRPLFAAYKKKRFRERVNTAIPYKAAISMLPVPVAGCRFGNDDQGQVVRLTLWRGRDDRNKQWFAIYPLGPSDARLFAIAQKRGIAQLVWQPKAKNRRRRWRLMIPCELPDAEGREGKATAGIDLGVNHLAVVSVPDLRRCAYFSRHDIPHRQRYYDERRRKAQVAGGAKAAGRWRDKEANFIRSAIDQTVRQIVEWLKQFDVGTINLEGLKGLREGADKQSVGGSASRMLSRFPYFQFQTRLRQVAEQEGFTVVEVEAAWTSRTCSKCGATGTRNSKRFTCACGYAAEADLNAANNIANRQPKETLPAAAG